MKIRALTLGLLLATAAPAFANEVDGKWTGSVDTPGGSFMVNFTFKAEGTKLTGASLAPDGTPVPIKNGKIDGTKISYSLDLDFGQGPVTINYTGIVSPGALKMQSEFMGMTNDFTLKKAT